MEGRVSMQHPYGNHGFPIPSLPRKDLCYLGSLAAGSDAHRSRGSFGSRTQISFRRMSDPMLPRLPPRVTLQSTPEC